LAAGLAWSGSAHAYCRTTTVHEQLGYDPVMAGQCWPAGKPLAWDGDTVVYSLSSSASAQVSLDDFVRIADASFQTWNGAQCGNGHPSMLAYRGGLVDDTAIMNDCGLVQCDPSYHDPQHVIVFRDTNWPHEMDPTNTLALTTVTYGVDTGTIFDADIEINTSMHQVSVNEPPDPGTYDLQSILTHEAGHFFGLAHALSTSSVMYAFYQQGATTLTDDDIAGICNIYPPAKAKSGCDTSSGGAGGGWWSVLVLAGVAAAARRIRSRRGSRA
jgi:MYXO-CTERM domain-containing protein